MLQAGSTGVVIGARFPSGMQMRPRVDWYRMELAIDGKPVQEFRYYDSFKLSRENRPRFVSLDPGTYEAQLWSNVELPIPKARFRLAPQQVLLIEAHPGCSKRIRGLHAELEVLSGRNEVAASSWHNGRVRKLKVMADYGCWPLWEEVDGTNVDPEVLPLSDDLISGLHAWQGEFDASLDEEYPPDSKLPDEAAFDRRGRELALELDRRLGPTFRVRYWRDAEPSTD